MAIAGTPERPRLDGIGAPIEYAVKMVQFAQDTLLSHLIGAGQLRAAHIDSLVHAVSAFHTRIATADPLSRFGTPAVIAHAVQRHILAQLVARLVPGGVLVVGTHETLPQDGLPLTAYGGQPGIFRKGAAQG